MEDVDLVVIGAGLYGLTSAATYHRLHPTARILVVDAAPSVGGPWASHRIFPGLKTNNLLGTYESPDFPMNGAKLGVKRGEHIPAEKVLEYMRAFADDSGLSGCVRLNTKVEIIEKIDDRWKLQCSSILSPSDEMRTSINTAKLIVAVGLVNKPSMPRYPTSPNFAPRIIHSKDFPAHFTDVAKAGTHTLVIGGGKSAWDIAYACATQPDSTVTMLIRPSGNGPVWMSPPYVTPFGLWLEKLVFTRFFGFMSPCPWAETSGFEGWIRSFLHRTWLGRKIVGAFWDILGDDVVQLNELNNHLETKRLRPWRGAFEVGTGLSILNYPTNFFDLVKEGKINVVIDEVDRLEERNEVILSGGQKLSVDAVICATGWEIGNTLKFRPDGLEKELGLPARKTTNAEDVSLVAKAETEIYGRFPFLKTRDTSRVHHPNASLRYAPTAETEQRPYRLYRFMVPVSDLKNRSIGFAGALMTLGNAPCAYLQSLWLTAYLDGTLELPDQSAEQLKYEIYRDTQYCIVRNAMGYGNKFPDLVFDSLPYFDEIMRDLGFEGKRKGVFAGMRNWAAECWQSYGPEDYKGLVDRWQERVRERGEDKKTI